MSSEPETDVSVRSLKQDINGLRQLYQQQNQEIQTLKEELAEEREHRKELQEQVDQQVDSNELVREIRKNGTNDWDAYAAIIVETLGREAGEDGVATMDAGECRKTLQGQPHRTNCYDILQHAADLVDSKMLEYIKEPRTSKRNSRLKLDRSVDDLPRRVGGRELEVGR